MSESDKIDKIMDSQQALLLEFREFRTLITQQQSQQAEKISEVRHELYGNGSPGLKANMQTIKSRCDSQACGTAIGKFMLSVADKVVSGAILAFVAWLLLMYAYSKTLPNLSASPVNTTAKESLR